MSAEALLMVLVVTSAYAILNRSILASGIAIGTAIIFLIAAYTGLPL